MGSHPRFVIICILKHIHVSELKISPHNFFLVANVRQGCNLSPLLFCLFISDLKSPLINSSVLGVKLVISYLSLFLFADDVLLFGNSPEDLQHSLNTLSSYCVTWNLTVNLSKTKVLVLPRMCLILFSAILVLLSRSGVITSILACSLTAMVYLLKLL